MRDAMSHVVTGESYHLVLSRAGNGNGHRGLRADLYGIVLLESLFTTSYIPAIRRLSDAEIVPRAHSVITGRRCPRAWAWPQGCSTCFKAS